MPTALPKMMLGFVVRRCTVALGHAPSPAEFAKWANAQEDGGTRYCVFGRHITEKEAALILRHPARPVSARSATPHEQAAAAEPTAPNVIPLDRATKRRATPSRARPRRR